MPSKSKQQQKFMGIVRSIQKGEAPAGKFSKAAQSAAKSMKQSSVKKYAKTDHDDLPAKVSENTKAELYKMYAKAMKIMPGSPSQKALIKKIDALRKKLGMNEAMSASQIKKMRDDFKKTGELPSHLKTLVKGKKEFEKKFKVKDIVIPGMEWMSKLGEERDYKDEYKKFQSSAKSKKYRAELNKYNRKKGTYGNGDGKDASHKGGKIVGFESQSKNRGRAEKSRLKKKSVKESKSLKSKVKYYKTISKEEWGKTSKDYKSVIDGVKYKMFLDPKQGTILAPVKVESVNEVKLNENPAAIAAAQAMTKIKMNNPKTGKKISAASALKNKDNPNHKKAKSIFQRLKDKFSKKKDDKPEPKRGSADSPEGRKAAAAAGMNVGSFTREGKLKEFIKTEIQKIVGVDVNEATSPKSFFNGFKQLPLYKEMNPNQRQAVNIALIMGGDMTGAVAAIEKIKKGLSKDKKVRNALKLANESVNEHTVTFTKDDMKKLHSSGEVIKADPDGKEHTYVYKEYVKV